MNIIIQKRMPEPLGFWDKDRRENSENKGSDQGRQYIIIPCSLNIRVKFLSLTEHECNKLQKKKKKIIIIIIIIK